jgi:predicted esterase
MMVGGAVLVIVLTALATLVVPVPVTAQTSGPILRLEIHPLESRTLSEEEFLTGARAGAPAVIAAELRLPRPTGRLPVVVLLHGSSGVRANVDRWAREINEIGVAALVVDSFTGRGIARTATDQAQLDSVVMIVDAYRALELLARHPRIDPARIALMGFSKGGFATLYASVKRFQRMHGPRDAEFAAYFAFYGTCQKRFLGDEDVADRPFGSSTEPPTTGYRSSPVGGTLRASGRRGRMSPLPSIRERCMLSTRTIFLHACRFRGYRGDRAATWRSEVPVGS